MTGPARADQVMDELLLREVTPSVIDVLVHREGEGTAFEWG